VFLKVSVFVFVFLSVYFCVSGLLSVHVYVYVLLSVHVYACVFVFVCVPVPVPVPVLFHPKSLTNFSDIETIMLQRVSLIRNYCFSHFMVHSEKQRNPLIAITLGRSQNDNISQMIIITERLVRWMTV
jgi:hypothetical protein